jgi:hypothetical protein
MATFADDPAGYFGERPAAMHLLPREEQEERQLEALRARFGAMRDAIPPLKALADAARLTGIDALEDVVPILFPHSYYKSFPQQWVHEGRHALLTEWLSRLSLADLSGVAGQSYDTVDAWMDALDAGTGIDITHSSGTSGALSLYPRGKADVAVQLATFRVMVGQWVDPIDAVSRQPDYAVIWPSYAGGRSTILKGAGMFRNVLAANPAMFYPLIPTNHSADWQIYLLRIDEARRRQAPPPEPSAYVQAKIAEGEEIQRTYAERVRFLLETIRYGLASTKCVLGGGPISLFRLATDGLAMGMEPGLAPGSIVRSFGGLKGLPEPENMEATILRFTGAKRIGNGYGMTELTTQFAACAEGHYHVPPWIVPMVLDPATGALLPRKGRRKGRAAFMDLLPQTYWGGVISADIVEVSWEGCACGRITPWVAPAIARVPGNAGGDHAIGPASDEAVHAALHALNFGIG